MGELVPLYRELAENGDNFRGLSLLQYAAPIQELIERKGAQTLLDYGSGRGEAYSSLYLIQDLWGVQHPHLYDPALAEICIRPEHSFDAVLCSDVLEHIPENELEDAIAYMMDHSRLFIWASICCRPAKKCFADGITNLHVTLQPLSWWRDLFAHHKDLRDYDGEVVLTETL